MPRKHGDFPSVRDAILYTASSLFTQKGVHGTSLGDIAAEAKLSKGTLYYYYSTKDELIVTITDDCLCHMTDILFSMADGHNARLYCVLCAECASEDTPIRELMTEYKQKWRLMLELGALKLQSRNAGILGERAELFFTLLSGHMLQTFGGMGSISIETLVDALMSE